jgi:hypothetical protein
MLDELLPTLLHGVAKAEFSFLDDQTGLFAWQQSEPFSAMASFFIGGALLFDVRRLVRLFACRKKFLNWRLLRADELGEESSFGQKLVDQDRADRVRLFVGFEVEQIVWHSPPNAHGLVRLAGVGRGDVLKDQLNGLGHICVRDGDEVVVHGLSAPF